jgi:hypothetical protein
MSVVVNKLSLIFESVMEIWINNQLCKGAMLTVAAWTFHTISWEFGWDGLGWI